MSNPPGNPAMAFFGCAACPENTTMEFSSKKVFDEWYAASAGVATKCSVCGTQWILMEIKFSGRFVDQNIPQPNPHGEAVQADILHFPISLRDRVDVRVMLDPHARDREEEED